VIFRYSSGSGDRDEHSDVIPLRVPHHLAAEQAVPTREHTVTASPATVAATPTSREPRTRDPYIDNLKGVLIALVVIGHTVGQFVDAAPGAPTVYTWIYSFHMPAFVLLCGVLAASPNLDERRSESIIRTIVVPFVIFQIGYTAFFQAGGRPAAWSVDGFLTPLYHLWFLMALVIWRLLAPLFARVRGAAFLALVLSLAAGLSRGLGDELSLNRTVALLPFFVVGLLMGGRALRLPTGRVPRIIAGIVLALGFPLASMFHDRAGRGWLFWRATYRSLDATAAQGITIRLGMMVWALVASAPLFVLIPRGRTFVATWGEHSMYPYLLHAFFVQAFGWWAVPITSVGGFAVATACALGLTAGLASRPVRTLFRPLVEPRAAFVVRPRVHTRRAVQPG
jgi:fucose 4-O-acetylase-like acetyltransferase